MTWEPDYVSLAEMKQYLDVGTTDGDALLAIYITAASRSVDGWCHRQFGQVAAPEMRTYPGTWDRYLGTYVYEIDDLMDIDDLTVVDADANEVTDYELMPYNAPQKGKPYERIVTAAAGPLVVDGKWGWTAVPAPAKNATLVQGARLAKRKDSPYGVAGSPSGDGGELRLLASLDPDLRTLLSQKYRREVWVS